MRIALIADVHGNRLALEAVLRQLDRSHVDRIVCLGDLAALGPDPAGALALVRASADLCVMGNTDAWLLGEQSGQPPAVSADATICDMVAWTRDRLSPDDVAYLQALPITAAIPLDQSRRMLLYHGSPRSLEDVIAAGTPVRQVMEMMDGQEGYLMAGGHTHIRLLRQIPAGIVINPGSVGLPGTGPGVPGLAVHHNVHWAEYATLTCAGGAIAAAFHRVPLSLTDMVAESHASGMPGFGWWASKWRSPGRVALPPD